MGKKNSKKGVQKRPRQDHFLQDPGSRAVAALVHKLEAKCEEYDSEKEEWAKENKKQDNRIEELERRLELLTFQTNAQVNHVALADAQAREVQALETSLHNEHILVDAAEVITEEEFNKLLPKNAPALIDMLNDTFSDHAGESGETFSLVILTKSKS